MKNQNLIHVNWLKRKAMLLLLLLLSVVQTYAQGQTVSGTVTSAEDQLGIPGVSIVVKGTTVGTTTDVDGKYSLNVPADKKVLIFSFVGMERQEVTITGSVVDVVMQMSTRQVDEVVVTALGIKRERKSLGYSVQEVSGEDISTVKDPNLVNSLSGKVAGVVITQSTGGPGSGSHVVIRGNNSLTGNNQPLYVVDGVPIDNSGFGSAAEDGTGEFSRTDYGTGVSDLNADDIESMSVLKGPNAAALYGSRAANGVILITTKKGRKDKGLGVSVSSNVTFDSPFMLPEYQNVYGQGTEGGVPETVDELKRGGSWGPEMDGSNKLYYTGEERPYSPQKDNVKDFFKQGVNSVNSFAIDGATDKSSFRFSYTNTNNNSMFPGAKLKKDNFNIRTSSDITDKFSVDAKVTYFQQETEGRMAQGTEGVMAYLYTMPRNVDIDDMKNFINDDLSVRTYSSNGGNPYRMLKYDVNDDTRKRMIGFVKANYEFTPNLSAFVRVGTDYLTQDVDGVSQFGHHFYPKGNFNYREYKKAETNMDFLVSYNKDITEDLNLLANVGGNMRHETYKYWSVAANDFNIPTKPTIESAKKYTPGFTPLREKRVNSLYGTLSGSYQNMLYLDATLRSDWSSTLPSDNIPYYYPSVSVSILGSELLKKIGKDLTGTMDYMKLRASVAQVGNDTGPYQLDQGVYNLATDGYNDLPVLSRPGTKLNADLKPEKITSSEIGLEMQFLNYRLYTDMSYYFIKSQDLIMDVPVDASTGYSRFRENVGEMTNEGFEILIGGVPFKTNDFSWDVSFNLSRNKNKLNKLIEGVEDFIFAKNNGGSVVVKGVVGGGFGDIYAKTWKINDNGKIVVNAEGKPQASDEVVKVGNYQPDMTMGLTNTFKYKFLTLRFQIDARIGGELYSGTDANLDASGVSDRTLAYRGEGITVPGAEYKDGDGNWVANDKRISAEKYWDAVSGIASEYVYDQTNVRLREVALSANLPQKWLNKTGFIKGATVSVIGRNLFMIAKDFDNFDPESSYSTSSFSQGLLYYTAPTTRSIGFNVNVKF